MPIARTAATLAALALATGLATADSWPGATITETFSTNRDWFVRVTPGTSVGDTVGFAGSPKGAFATAEWFARTSDAGYRIAARATLANPVAPVQSFVTDRGYLVTLDNWHNLGYGSAVAAYRPDGTRVVALALADLYSKGEIAAFPHSVSSIGWRSESQQAYVRQDQRSIYVAGKNPGDELLLEPETGRWQVCQPRAGTHQCRTANEPRAWGAFREPEGAEASLRNDLHALVQAGVRVGAVLGTPLDLQSTAPRLGGPAPPRNRRGWIAWLETRWSTVLTVTDRPVVRLAAKTAPVCEAGLAQQVDVTTIGGNAAEVMFGIAKTIDASLATLPPPGILSGGGSGGRSPLKTVQDRVRLTGGRITVEAALDQFVTRLDGWGWWVEERCSPESRCSCRVGMLTEDRVLSPTYDISPLTSR